MTPLERYKKIKVSIAQKAKECGRHTEDITLLAVTKGRSIENMQYLYDVGIKRFGESRMQQALPKISQLPADCEWHFIGNLQSNKMNKIIPYFSLIHSVDSFESAKKISQWCSKNAMTASILLQVNTSGEKEKKGNLSQEWEKKLDMLQDLPFLSIQGLMTMAPLTQNQDVIRSCFRTLYELREKWRLNMKNPLIFQHLSMGMSHDYLIAIEEGATILRIGSALFQ